jgi:hypothetical protein
VVTQKLDDRIKRGHREQFQQSTHRRHRSGRGKGRHIAALLELSEWNADDGTDSRVGPKIQ